MASCLISDAPYAAWLSDVLATLEEHKVTKIAVAAPLPGGEVFTGYFDMGTMDKALMATNIQADATMAAICANGPLIQQAWENAEEDDDTDDLGEGVIPVWTVIVAAGIPTSVLGFCFWMLERRIERREKQQEAAEKAREEFETHLYESSLAAIALGEATARAVQRIPDAHCNGDMHAALDYAAAVKHQQRDFVAKRGIRAIIN